ncbi:MAG: class I SAM-dependent methyltransferase [Alterinioella nitratireducens]|uniref:class I SAM-dependent methyltransferase n=1 Tax=Alterinioella nitratireducens TaxID=2735915 RepID=UPI00405A1F5B
MAPKLLCPDCAQPMNGASECSACGFVIDTENDITDLRVDKSFDTLLDVEDYDKVHSQVDVNHSLGQCFFDLMQQGGRSPGGDVLEIAAGSGNLTMPLLQSGHFSSVIASDISPAFLKRLSARYDRNPSDTVLHKALFDANRLPFEDDQFDFVVGNSVLHHFARFETTLAEARRVLHPGGMAIFGEPIIDTHVFVSFAAGVMVRFFDKNPDKMPAPKAYRVLKAMQAKTAKKMDNLDSDRTGLTEIEDKFQFPLGYMRQLSRDLGYSDFVVRPGVIRFGTSNDFGAQIRHRVSSVLERTNTPSDFLDEFDFLFEALAEDYARPIEKYLSPLFNFFGFVK